MIYCKQKLHSYDISHIIRFVYVALYVLVDLRIVYVRVQKMLAMQLFADRIFKRTYYKHYNQIRPTRLHRAHRPADGCARADAKPRSRRICARDFNCSDSVRKSMKNYEQLSTLCVRNGCEQTCIRACGHTKDTIRRHLADG